MVLLDTVLPHPDMPAGNETVTVATKGKERNLQMIPGVESSVYTRTNDSGRFWINYTYCRNEKTLLFSPQFMNQRIPMVVCSKTTYPQLPQLTTAFLVLTNILTLLFLHTLNRPRELIC